MKLLALKLGLIFINFCKLLIVQDNLTIATDQGEATNLERRIIASKWE